MGADGVENNLREVRERTVTTAGSRRSASLRDRDCAVVQKRASTPLHFQLIADPGACGKTRVVAQNRLPGPEATNTGSRNACVSAYIWARVTDRQSTRLPHAAVAGRLRSELMT